MHTCNATCLTDKQTLIQILSHSLTFNLCLFENTLNNLDLLGSAKTHNSQPYDVIRVREQDCDAYTVRLLTNPDFIRLDLLVQLQDCRATKKLKPETQN